MNFIKRKFKKLKHKTNTIKRKCFTIPNEDVLAKTNTSKLILPNELHEYIRKYSSCRSIRILHSLNNNCSNIYPYSLGIKDTRQNDYRLFYIKYRFIKNVPITFQPTGVLETQIMYNEKSQYLVIIINKIVHNYDCNMWTSCHYNEAECLKLYMLTYLPIVLWILFHEYNRIYDRYGKYTKEYKQKYDGKNNIYDKLFQPLIKRFVEYEQHELLVNEKIKYKKRNLIITSANDKISSSRRRDLVYHPHMRMIKFLYKIVEHYVNF